MCIPQQELTQKLLPLHAESLRLYECTNEHPIMNDGKVNFNGSPVMTVKFMNKSTKYKKQRFIVGGALMSVFK